MGRNAQTVCPVGKGTAGNMKWTARPVGEVDLGKLVVRSGPGLDEAQRRANTTKCSRTFSALSSIVQLFERYGNNPC